MPYCGREDELDDDTSSSSSDSESDSDSEVAPPGDSQENLSTDASNALALTLLDDDEEHLLPPGGIDGDAGEGKFEGEGEGEEDDLTADQIGNKDEKSTDTAIDADKPKKKKKKKKKFLYICLSSCKYESVRRMSKKFGFREVSDDDDWNLFWTDYSVALDRVMEMKKYQKINHFPGMSEICRKDMLARNMNRMLKLFPKEYNVFPKSWCLPADYGDLQAYARQKKHKTYILKPENGCQGRGIWVTKSPKEIKSQEHMLCQQYVSRPFVIDGFKFDLRIYVLVTGCDPLRIFVFKDGLARFATVKYCEPTSHNVGNVFMHLTNYAINKTSNDFIRDDEAGSKRRITTVNRWLRNSGYDLEKIWSDVDDVIIKTLISAHPILKHNYRTCFPNHVRASACFEILGFDLVFDRKLKPLLLEVNHSPSFHTDAKIDKEIKEALIADTLCLVNFGAVDRRKCIEEEKRKVKERLFQKQNRKESKEEQDKAQQQWADELSRYEDSHLGNFRRIYPGPGHEKYEKYFHNSGSLYQETAAFKARSECARQQREEILRKQEKLQSMLKKKKDYLRPESPGVGKRRRPKKAAILARGRLTGRGCEVYQSVGCLGVDGGRAEAVDTRVPVEIVESEELERVSSLLQRDNLVRGLGIVEHVYRLLHCTPGTMGVQLRTDRHHTFSQLASERAPSTNPSASSVVATTRCQHQFWSHDGAATGHRRSQKQRMLPAAAAAAAAGHHSSGGATVPSAISERSLLASKYDDSASLSASLSCESDVDHDHGKVAGPPQEATFAKEETTNRSGYVLPTGTSRLGQPGMTNGSYCLQKTVYHHGLVNTQARDLSQWKRNGQSLGQLNERSLPLRTRYSGRKHGNPGNDHMTIPENDYRQMARALEVDSDRLIARQHGLYGRHGFESRGDSANSRQAAIVKHLQKPVREIGVRLSPHLFGYQQVAPPLPHVTADMLSLAPCYGGGVAASIVKVVPRNATSANLSVVSAPAPVVRRHPGALSHPRHAPHYTDTRLT